MNKDKVSSMKLRESTKDILKEIALVRGRRESLEQVVLELAYKYMKDLNE